MTDQNQVIVIVGASSGIGRRTAELLAGGGVKLVLAARSLDVLQEIAEACETHGAEVLSIGTDVSKEEEVERLAKTATGHFGRIDVWINAAAVTIVGHFLDITPQQFKQVIDTNFYGVVHGSRAALRQFYEQDSGHLINISSVFGMVPSPYESPYVASKHALRGFDGVLREEARLAGKKAVNISTVLPSAIDTPIYRNAANLTGKAIKPPQPIYSTDTAAIEIIKLIDNPRPETIIGAAGKQLVLVQRLLPKKVFEYAFGKYIAKTHFTDLEAIPTEGNLDNPSPYPFVSGGWDRPTTTVTYASAAAAGAAVLTLLLLHRRRRRR